MSKRNKKRIGQNVVLVVGSKGEWGDSAQPHGEGTLAPLQSSNSAPQRNPPSQVNALLVAGGIIDLKT